MQTAARMDRSRNVAPSLIVSEVSARPTTNHIHTRASSVTAVRPIAFRHCGRAARCCLSHPLHAKISSTGTHARAVDETTRRTIEKFSIAANRLRYHDNPSQCVSTKRFHLLWRRVIDPITTELLLHPATLNKFVGNEPDFRFKRVMIDLHFPADHVLDE
jgi:hypothetical protein